MTCNFLLSLQLYASVLMKDPVSVGKAKNLLQRALSQDDVYLTAVYLLAEIHEQEMNLEEAITLLEKQVEIQSTCKLHETLGDLWARVHNEEKALEHYAIALKYILHLFTIMDLKKICKDIHISSFFHL